METNLLSAADLLAGSKAVQDVTIPAAVLQPAPLGSGEAGASDASVGDACGPDVGRVGVIARVLVSGPGLMTAGVLAALVWAAALGRPDGRSPPAAPG